MIERWRCDALAAIIRYHVQKAEFMGLKEAESTNLLREAADIIESVVWCADCRYNNHCLTQEFVKEESKIPFDRNTFFCADGARMENEE